MLTVYGIKQCDTCRKARVWLDGAGIAHRFHDLRADGLQPEQLTAWLGSEFAAALVNRRSTTWRQLTDAQRAAAGADLMRLLLDHPTLIKRPVFTRGGNVIAVGFDPGALAALDSGGGGGG
jgi:Spx/MgsR family transcriptional regulator